MYTRAAEGFAHHLLDHFLSRALEIEQRLFIRFGPIVVSQVLIKASDSVQRVVFACDRQPLHFRKALADTAMGLFKLLVEDFSNPLGFSLFYYDAVTTERSSYIRMKNNRRSRLAQQVRTRDWTRRAGHRINRTPDMVDITTGWT